MISSEIRKMIQIKITSLFGEKAYSLFSNHIGRISVPTLEEEFNFTEIVELNKSRTNPEFIDLLELCNENQLITIYEFLVSFMEGISAIYDRYSDLAQWESDKRVNESTFKIQASDLYNKNGPLFKKEFGKLIMSNQQVKNAFQEVFLKNQTMDSMSTDELREAIRLLSITGISRILNRKYGELKEKPMNNFKTFFNEDETNMATRVAQELQDNGI